MWHLLLEVVDAVELFLLQVPDVEDTRLLFSADANGNEHLVAFDAGSLPDVIGWEARVEVLNAIVVEGVSWIQVYNGAVAQLRHGEDHRAPSVAFSHVLDGVAVTYQPIVLGVYHPLQCVTEESVGVVEHDGLHQLRLARQRDALHEADVLHASIALLGTLRDIKQGELVGLVVAFCAEEGDVGVILCRMACERELPHWLELVVLETIDGGLTCVLQAHEIVAIDSHPLITLLLDALQVGYFLH